MNTWPKRSKCGHDAYWIGNYGTCMACRADKAEAEAAKLREERDAMKCCKCHDDPFCIRAPDNVWKENAKLRAVSDLAKSMCASHSRDTHCRFCSALAALGGKP